MYGSAFHITSDAMSFKVMEGGPEVLEEMPERTLFLCYPPPMDPMARTCLKKYKGKHVVHGKNFPYQLSTLPSQIKLFKKFCPPFPAAQSHKIFYTTKSSLFGGHIV